FAFIWSTGSNDRFATRSEVYREAQRSGEQTKQAMSAFHVRAKPEAVSKQKSAPLPKRAF
ncbi:MAG: hypothetical protein AAFO88_10925, partial [Pseudomonadota bacterium]